jgi:hypothetical protein
MGCSTAKQKSTIGSSEPISTARKKRNICSRHTEKASLIAALVFFQILREDKDLGKSSPAPESWTIESGLLLFR